MMLSAALKIIILFLCVSVLYCTHFEKVYSYTFTQHQGNIPISVNYSVFGYGRLAILRDFDYTYKKTFLYQKIYESGEEIRKMELFYNVAKNDTDKNISFSINIPMSNPMFSVVNIKQCTFIQGHKSQLNQISNTTETNFRSLLSNRQPSQVLSCPTQESQNNRRNTMPYSSNTVLFTLRLLSSRYPITLVFMFSKTITTNNKRNIFLPCWNPFYHESAGSTNYYGFWNLNSYQRISSTFDFRKHFNLFVKNENLTNIDDLYQCFVYDRYQRRMAVFTYYIQFNIQITQSRSRIKRSIEKQKFSFHPNVTSIHIKWLKPPVKISQYKVSWGIHTSSEKTIQLPGNATSYIIGNIAPNTKIYVRVISIKNGKMYSNSLEEIFTLKNITGDSLPIPMEIKPISINSTWVTLTWSTSMIRMDLISDIFYKVICAMGSIDKGKNLVHDSVSRPPVKLTGLKPDKPYQCVVQTCLNMERHKCGSRSFLTNFKTEETVPFDAPRDLTLSQTVPIKNSNKINDMYPASVHVAWQPPDNPNGQLKSYIILMTSENEPDTSKWISKTVSPKNLNTVMNRLELNRHYFFRIYCINKHGRSPLSEIKVYKTPKLLSEQGKQINLAPTLSKMNFSRIYNTLANKNNGTNLNGQSNSLQVSDSNGMASTKKIIIFSCITVIVLFTVVMIVIAVVKYCRTKTLASRMQRGMQLKNNMSDVIDPLHGNPDHHSSHLQQHYNIPQMGSLRKHQQQSQNQQQSPPPILTTPDLFRHTNSHNDSSCGSGGGKMYQDMGPDRNDSPNSFNSGKDIPGYNMKTGTINSMAGVPTMHHPHFMNPQMMRPTQNQFGFDISPQNIVMLPRSQVSNANVVMTTSQIATSSCNNNMDPNFYPVAFLPHMSTNHGAPPATVSPPRVNAAASDFNSINFDSNCMLPNSNAILSPGRPVAIAGSQGTVLFEMSTPQSSGGKSSLSGSGSCNGGFSKAATPFVNTQPINEDYNNSVFNSDDPQPNVKNAFSNEELSQEMENLEGLMKDLNQITQKEFEC